MKIASAIVSIQPATSADGKPMVTQQGERMINYDFENHFFFFADGVPPIPAPGEYGLIIKGFFANPKKGSKDAKRQLRRVCSEWWSVNNPTLSSATLARRVAAVSAGA